MLGAELQASCRHSNKLSCTHQDHRQVQSYYALMLCTQFDPLTSLRLTLLLNWLQTPQQQILHRFSPGSSIVIESTNAAPNAIKRHLSTAPTVTEYCCEISQDALNLSSFKSQLAELQHNNSILKRAVAIQNNRIQDLSSREAESQQLKQVVAQLQEKCHGLELNNYSLAMHLRHATDNGSQSQQGQRHPDVY